MNLRVVFFFAVTIAVVALFASRTSAPVVHTIPKTTRTEFPMTISIDNHGKPATPFQTVRSMIVKPGGPIIHGVPANNLGAPVAVLSCDADFHDWGMKTWFAIRTTVLNNTGIQLRYTRIVYRIENGGAYSDAILFDLKPHEMRTFRLTDGDPDPMGGASKRSYPRWMLCGAGPAQKADGTMLTFEPEFLTP